MFSPEELSALWLSAKVAFWATLVSLPFAIAVAWWLVRVPCRFKFLVEASLQLPMVLPPVVLGYILLIVFGSQGVIGGWLQQWGIQLAFDWKGAVVASIVVAFPLMVQPIKLSFQMMDNQMEQAAATLGANAWQIFSRIYLPLALPGITIGSILCFSRSLGEFGATITFVGNIPDETRTIPIAIYSLLQQPNGDHLAIRLVVLSMILAFSALLTNHFILYRYKKQLD
ncbi:MAG: molybdate ABC transporter permease subunit [Acinetobacter sp.]